MKNLKTIFSPRKLIVWLFILILIIAIPELTNPSLSETDALVSMLCVDLKDGEYEIAALVLTPGQERVVNTQVYTGSGETLGEAVNNVSISIGKLMGFAQCELIAFGDNLCKESIIPAIDYMTRTKRVGRSAVLVSFEGETSDFASACSKLAQEKSLRLDEIINYDKRYILAKDSNVDSFYKGYYSEISIGIMPHLKVESEQKTGAIEVASSSQSSSGGGESGGGQTEQKKYLVNDGTTSIFKNGKKEITLKPEQVVDINLLQDNEQEGVFKVENVTDEIYKNATIVFLLKEKSIKLTPTFNGDIPVFKMDLEVRVLVDEVLEEEPGKEFIRRNREFLTPTAINKFEAELKSKLMETVSFCKENEVDLIGVYRYFYSLQYNKFKNYLEKEKNYLNGIDFQISIEVNSAY